MPSLHSMGSPIAGLAFIALVIGPTLLAGQDIAMAESFPIVTCARADSLLGRMPDGRFPHLQGARHGAQVYLHTGFAAPSGQADQVNFSVTAATLPSTPAGILSVMLTGDLARATLARGVAPDVRILLPDSLVLSPRPVALGRYDGQPALAVAPVTAPLPPASLAAVVVAREVTILVGDARMQLTAATMTQLRNAYRTALCGVGGSAPAP